LIFDYFYRICLSLFYYFYRINHSKEKCTSFGMEHYDGQFSSLIKDRYLDPLEFWTDDDHLNKFIGLVEASVDLDQLENGEYMISSSYDPTLSALPFDFVSWVSSHELDVS
jgi:hypothetical protein